MQYVELHCKSNFSFLHGASHPHELVQRAAEIGYAGIALTDRESVAGVVRGFIPARDLQKQGSSFQYIVATEVHPTDAPPMVLWPTDRAAYGRMCRMISRGRMRCEKGSSELKWRDVIEFSEGIVAGLLPTAQHSFDDLSKFLATEFRDVFADRNYLMCELHRGVDDGARVQQLKELSTKSGVPLVAAGDVYYHTAERMLMHDCVTAIRNGTTIDRVHEQRFANSQRHLRSLAEIADLYRDVPNAIERTVEIAEQCTFTLDELRYEYCLLYTSPSPRD